MLPQAYDNALKELKRRENFNVFFTYLSERLKIVAQDERSQRVAFNQKFGIYLPRSLLPELTSEPLPDFTYVCQNQRLNDYQREVNLHKLKFKELVS